MAKYQIVSLEEFSKLRWKRYENYKFASKDIVVSLAYEELPKAALTMPIFFLRENQEFTPVALLGFRSGKNLYVSPDGRWLSNYVPAQFRAYPFAIANFEQNKLVLCVDRESELVGENFENPFFEQSGEPTSLVNDILNFLTQLWYSRKKTLEICKLINELELIVPWTIKVVDQAGEQVIEGLYRVDEEKFRKLEPGTLQRLHTTGALDIIYCHLLSLENINTLKALAEAQAKAESKNQIKDIDLSFLNQSGNISF